MELHPDILEAGAVIERKTMTDCNGLYWRGSVNIFSEHDTGRIKEQKELRLLKRMSCKGCEKCGWVFEAINDQCYASHFSLDGIEHGKVYTYKVSTSTDWETGYVDIDGIDFVEVEE